MRNELVVDAWLQRARSNLAKARLGRMSDDILYEDLCFECQQVVEKLLKALLVSLEATFPWTHLIARLLEELASVKKWGDWVLREAKKELAEFYPEEPDGSIPVGWIWARTIPCQNPSCGVEIPLMRQFWLAKKAKKKVTLYPTVEAGQVVFKVVGDGYEPMPADFDPGNGTVSRAVAVCPVCGSAVEAKYSNTTSSRFTSNFVLKMARCPNRILRIRSRKPSLNWELT